jgi:Tfp pilus assembly protein PilF
MRYRTGQFFGAFIIFLGFILILPGCGQYREYYFYGRVIDTQKNPLEGVELSLLDIDTSRHYFVKTNKNGEFKFAGLPHGTYKVTFKKEGYATKEDEWKFTATQDRIQKVEIPPVTLVAQELVEKEEMMKKMQGVVKEALEKIRQSDFDGAIAILKDVLAKDPKDSNALFLIGIAYSKKQMWPEAIDVLTQVTQLVPNFARTYFELAVCYQKQNDPEKALEYYQKNLDLDPSNPDSAFNSGLILFGMNRIDEALARFENALTVRPDDAAYLEMAGRCYIHQANFAKAIEYLEKAKAGYTDKEKIDFLDNLIAKLKEQIKQ